MSRLFSPAVSYWPRAGGIRYLPYRELRSVLASHRSVVLLIHGFNTNEREAAASYERFMRLQAEQGLVTGHVVGVYWPGDSWSGPLYYMKAVGQAQRVASFLAADLHLAAELSGVYRVDIVAHSLGTRLALETVRELQARLVAHPVPGLTIGRIAFLASAVPTHYLESDPASARPLEGAIAALEAGLNLYSEADRVLQLAFPPGQTAAGEGFLPTALGRSEWAGGRLLFPPLRQQRNPGADHSDYWGGSSGNEAALREAARAVREFIDLGPPPARAVPVRTVTPRLAASGRQPAAPRIIEVRET